MLFRSNLGCVLEGSRKSATYISRSGTSWPPRSTRSRTRSIDCSGAARLIDEPDEEPLFQRSLNCGLVQPPANVVSTAKLSPRLTYSEARRSTSRPARMVARGGMCRLIRLAIRAPQQISLPWKSTSGMILLLLAPFGPAKTVKTRTSQAAVSSSSQIPS